MQNSNHSHAHKGGSEKSILPKENRPENQPEEGQPQEEKQISIGMPISEEEMKKLKEDAKKMDR